jgi:DNA-binding MarR family transcriptional regulator
MGEVASELGVAPSTATAYCDRLERLGLIVRERRGREVRFARTERGSELIDVMAH